MVAYNRMEQISFFSARKFRAKLLLSGLEMTLFDFHCLTQVWRITSRDLNGTVFKMAVDWASKKICRKFDFALYIVYLLI